MPAVYVDTSALVKRYVGEVGTRWVRLALARPVRQRIYTALLAHTEVLSALQRKIREGTLAVAEAQRLARRVQHHCARRYRLVAITPARVTQANALVQAHPLRAYDALHLACALAVRDALQPYGLPAPVFVTADDALLAAARAEGFAVDNPLQYP
ncbi:MAG TPA: type II toxin-antitoxin system VapC family toxin [Candidatus Tectomicrobia bacterium]